MALVLSLEELWLLSLKIHGKSNRLFDITSVQANKVCRRWIFRLNMPLTAFTTLCVIFVMPLRPVQGSWKKKLKAIDFLGVILTLSGSTLIVVRTLTLPFVT